MTGIIVGGVLVLLVIGVPIAMKLEKGWHDKAWGRVAAARDGMYNKASGGRGFDQLALVTPKRSRVEVVPVQNSNRNQRAGSAVVWSAAFSGGGPAFRIFRRKGRLILPGQQDVELGSHPAFDKHFVIEAANPDGVRACWNVETQQALLTHFPKGEIVSDGQRVKLLRDGLCRNESVLHAGLDIVESITAPPQSG
jgi:hypothetical protein